MDVLLRSELVHLLGGRRAFARALDDGTWQRLLRGTYAPGPLVPDLALRAGAAARLLPEHAVVADRCLLWLLGVDVLPPGPPVLEVVVPRGAVVPRREDVRARTAELSAADVLRLPPGGLRCLRPDRAVADLLRLLPFVEAVVVADAAQHAGVCRGDALRRELSAAAGLRNVVRARRALELSDARAESPPESRLRLAFRAAGLVLEPQHVVLDASGRFVARVDLALPDLRIAVEHDGRAVHDRADAFVADRRRQNALVAAGWTVLRFTATDLRWGAAPAVAQLVAAAEVARQSRDHGVLTRLG